MEEIEGNLVAEVKVAPLKLFLLTSFLQDFWLSVSLQLYLGLCSVAFLKGAEHLLAVCLENLL